MYYRKVIDLNNKGFIDKTNTSYERMITYPSWIVRFSSEIKPQLLY